MTRAECEAAIWRALAAHRQHGEDGRAYRDITAALSTRQVTYAREYVSRLTPAELRAALRAAEATAEAFPRRSAS